MLGAPSLKKNTVSLCSRIFFFFLRGGCSCTQASRSAAEKKKIKKVSLTERKFRGDV